MTDAKEKIKKNQRIQRALVDAHQKNMRDVVRPYLRKKKICHSERVEELTRKSDEKAGMQIEMAREHLKKQKEAHREDLKVQKEHIRQQQIKQRVTARAQTENKNAKILPVIKENRRKIEVLKRNSRKNDQQKGKLLFAYPTMPSKDFADSTTYSPKQSGIPDPEFAEKITYSPAHSTVPDVKFADKTAVSSSFSSVSKPQFAEGTMHSCKHSTAFKLKKI